MRGIAVLTVFLCLVPLVSAQLRPEEEKALSDTLFLNNLNLQDLKYLRRIEPDTAAIGLVHRCVDTPLSGVSELMQFHEKALTAMPSDLIRTARLDILGDEATRISLPDSNPGTVPDVVPDELKPIVADYARAVSRADDYVHLALSRLTPVEKRILVDSLPTLAAESRNATFDFELTTPDRKERVLDLLASVDLPLIRSAAEGLALQVERDISRLETIAKHSTWQGHVAFRFGHIKVEVSGVGNDIYDDKNTQLVIDLGGSNHFSGREGAGVLGAALLVDCGSSESFDQHDLGAGCGLLGVGLAYMLGGNNSMSAGSLAFGAGLGGVGIIYVNGGNSHFSCKSLCEGFGEFGIGGMLENGPSNRFLATSWAQGAARTQGVGWLVDKVGGNLLQLNGTQESFDSSAPNLSRGQAYSEGYESLGGGVGMVSLGAGEETLIGQSECQSSASKFGLASLYQSAGRHAFVADESAQACAEGQSASYLFSLSGDGSFLLNAGKGQSFASGGSVAFLLDRAGSNSYADGESGPAEAVDKGLAVFLHGSGKDRFSGPAGVGVNTGSSDALGLYVDMDAESRPDQPSGVALVRPGMGISLSQDLNKHVVAGLSVSRNNVKPGTVALPAPDVLQVAYGLGTNPSSADEVRQESRDKFVSYGMPGLQWLFQNKLAGASMDGEALIGDVARVIGQPGRDELALKIAQPDDASALHALRICMDMNFKEAGALIAGALNRPALQREAALAAGQFDAKDTVSTLMVLASQQDETLVLNAVTSLTELADPASLSTAQVLVSSPDLMVREAAIRLIAAIPGGIDTARILAKDPDERAARVGVQILGKIGSPQALSLAGVALNDVRSGVRIQALLALSGRVPDKFRARVEELKTDPSVLVRAVVAGMPQ